MLLRSIALWVLADAVDPTNTKFIVRDSLGYSETYLFKDVLVATVLQNIAHKTLVEEIEQLEDMIDLFSY